MICRLLFLFRTTIRSLLNCLPYVLTCQCVLLSYVLTCLACLHACVSTCFACSRANVSLRTFVLTCQRVLRAYVPTCLACSRAVVLTCQRVFAWHAFLRFWYFFLVSVLWNKSTTSKSVFRISFSDFSCTFRHISYQAENVNECYDKLCTIQWFWFLFK